MSLDTSQEPAILEPAVLAGRYRLGERLGCGATAEVWRGFDERLRRDVAVKVLDLAMAAEPGVRERFDSEARAAAGLCHPNIVSVYDTGEHDGVPFLVMELLGGRTLADEMATGPLAESRVRDLGLQILDALDTSHRAGIVHRDIKPANILFTQEGTAKIGDFGIARSTGSHGLTETGTVIGTTNYMAPERAAGEPASPRTDIYAVGILMYEALAGRKPFSADTPIGIIRAAQSGEVFPLDVVRSDLDPSLIAVVRRAMAADPQNRYSSAATMASALSAPLTTEAALLRQADATVVTATAFGTTDTTVATAMGAGDLTAANAATAAGEADWTATDDAIPAVVTDASTGDATVNSPLPSGAFSSPARTRSLLRDRTLLLIGAAAAVTLILVMWAGNRVTESPAVGEVESSQVAEPTTVPTPSSVPLATVVTPAVNESEVEVVDETAVEDRGTRRQRERDERQRQRELERALKD